LIIEVIAVGTELLIGQIVNSNAAVIGSRLAEDGFDAHYQVTVGDNLARLVAAIEVALARSDAVLITGGIGPTRDDLTREALCQVGGRVMVREQAHAAWIKDRLRPGGGEVNPTVLRMADLPEGSLPLANPNGVALGVAMEVEGKWIFAVPGVPAETRKCCPASVGWEGSPTCFAAVCSEPGVSVSHASPRHSTTCSSRPTQAWPSSSATWR
jgi:nicotinamide-nucleotide amidase